MNRAGRSRERHKAGAAYNRRVLEAVGFAEIEKILELTDRLGIHREMVVIPLRPRHPGGVRRMPNGKLEIVVDAQAEFAAWLGGLEPEIRKLSS
jgi:hypothetical protein